MSPVYLNRNPVKEGLTPSPDGVIVDFYTSRDYVFATVSLWLNGLRQEPEGNFLELGGSLIRLTVAPELEDSIQAQYDPV